MSSCANGGTGRAAFPDVGKDGVGVGETVVGCDSLPNFKQAWGRKTLFSTQKLSIMDEANRTIVMAILLAVQVLVTGFGVAYRTVLVLLQKQVRLFHAHRQHKEQQQQKASQGAVYGVSKHQNLSMVIVQRYKTR